jgi:hypothetical protein
MVLTASCTPLDVTRRGVARMVGANRASHSPRLWGSRFEISFVMNTRRANWPYPIGRYDIGVRAGPCYACGGISGRDFSNPRRTANGWKQQVAIWWAPFALD